MPEERAQKPRQRSAPVAALAYDGDKLIGIETDGDFVKPQHDEWVSRGFRVELTTYDDALSTWRRYWEPNSKRGGR